MSFLHCARESLQMNPYDAADSSVLWTAMFTGC